jgi:hypothetical protein
MPKRAGSHLARPRHSRSRGQRPLVQSRAPDLPAVLWQMLAGILARTSPYDCLKLSMVCRGARASIVEDEQLWLSILRRSEREYWEVVLHRGSYHYGSNGPFPFAHLSVPPDFMRGRPATCNITRHRHLPPKLLHTLPEDALSADQ